MINFLGIQDQLADMETMLRFCSLNIDDIDKAGCEETQKEGLALILWELSEKAGQISKDLRTCEKHMESQNESIKKQDQQPV